TGLPQKKFSRPFMFLPPALARQLERTKPKSERKNQMMQSVRPMHRQRSIRVALLLPATLLLAALLGSAVTTQALAAGGPSPLNPASFTSLGASPFLAAGTYAIDSSKNNAVPTLSGPGIALPIQGVFYSPSGGTVVNDEIAVFTFDSLNIPASVTVGYV